MSATLVKYEKDKCCNSL